MSSSRRRALLALLGSMVGLPLLADASVRAADKGASVRAADKGASVRAADKGASVHAADKGASVHAADKSASAAPSACPGDMALVDGEFCPRVEQRCLRWMDPPGRYHEYRCAEYARPARCLAPRRRSRFCIDRRERSAPDTGLPYNGESWTDAKGACEAVGARVCKDSEWTFACEGEEMRPYPYGFSRTPGLCNADRVDLLMPGDPRRLRDEREPAGAHPGCSSPFGVLDMAGNVAEWVSVDGFPEGAVVVQKGNWWQPGKQACRDAQAGHDRFYKGTETGFRCCASAADLPVALVANGAPPP